MKLLIVLALSFFSCTASAVPAMILQDTDQGTVLFFAEIDVPNVIMCHKDPSKQVLNCIKTTNKVAVDSKGRKAVVVEQVVIPYGRIPEPAS